MSILSSNNAGIKSKIEGWLDTYATPDVLLKINFKEQKNYPLIEVDCDVLIHDFPEEKFPDFIVFTKINGNFELSQCHKLNNVAGFPLEVTGDFVCEGCENLEEDAIRYVEKDRVWNMQTVDPNDPKSVKGWLNYFESGRAEELPLRKINGKIVINNN